MRWPILLLLALTTAPRDLPGQASATKALSPSSLPPTRGYSHIVIAPAGPRAIISGQVAVDSTGAVVGAGDFEAQCVQVFENLRIALASVGATFADVVSTNTYVTDLSRLAVLREVRARYLPASHPPASTLVQVVALYRPELMIEVSAEVSLPAKGAAR